MPTISKLDRVIGPRRLHSLLLDRSRSVRIENNEQIVVSIAPHSSDPTGESSAVVLPRGDGEGDGGGLRGLFGQIVSSSAVEGVVVDTSVRAVLPIDAGRWLRGHRLVTRLLAAAFESGFPEVASAETVVASHGISWLLQYESRDRTPMLRLIVSEPRGSEDGGTPSPALGRAIAKQREMLSTVLGADINLRSRTVEPTSIDWVSQPGRSPPAFTTRSHSVIVYPPSLELFLGTVRGRAVSVPIPESEQRHLDLLFLDRLLRHDGFAELIVSAPQSGAERRARFAVRTCIELIRTGGVVSRTIADSAYRSALAYDRALAIIAGVGDADREILRRAYGRRRWPQIENHVVHRRSAEQRLPWVRFAEACESLCSELADRSRRPGYAPPSPVIAVVDRYYRTPRRVILREVWQKQIEAGSLREVLDAARLSVLRGYLRAIPREVLLRAACGEIQFVRERLSSAYGRRGRRFFNEDLVALEGQIERKEYEDWESILAARAAVYAAARRA